MPIKNTRAASKPSLSKTSPKGKPAEDQLSIDLDARTGQIVISNSTKKHVIDVKVEGSEMVIYATHQGHTTKTPFPIEQVKGVHFNREPLASRSFAEPSESSLLFGFVDALTEDVDNASPNPQPNAPRGTNRRDNR